MNIDKAGYWRKLNKPHLGFLNQVSDFLYAQHIAIPFLFRDLRHSESMIVVSDYGGEHSKSPVITYSFLLFNPKSISSFLSKCSTFRSGQLGRSRRISYAKLNDRVKYAVLNDFLQAANSINGMLFTIAIFKDAELFDSGVIQSELNFLPELKIAVASKMLSICHWLSMLLSCTISPGQDIVWVSDQDAITANTTHIQRATYVLGHFLNHYLNCNARHIKIGTTVNDPGDLSLEDAASIPDLAAGALADIVCKSGIVTEKDAKAKAQPIIGWLCDERSDLAKISIVIRQNTNGKLLMQLLRP